MESFIPETSEVHKSGTLSGSGAFSKVYILPDGKVVKINEHMHCDGWMWWALYCMVQGDNNPLLPTIHAMRLDLKQNLCTAVMDQYEDHLEGTNHADPMGRYQPWHDVEDDIASLHSAFLLWVLEYTSDEFYFDADCTVNWMVHPGTTELVLTDPFTISGWRDMKRNAPDNAQKTRKHMRDFLRAAHDLSDKHGLQIEIV